MSRVRIGKRVGGGGIEDYIAAEGALIRQGLNGINGGVTAAVTGEIDGQRLKTISRCHVGPAVSERERRPVPIREKWRMGRGWLLELGWNVSPGPI
jgi:hypothetical protein